MLAALDCGGGVPSLPDGSEEEHSSDFTNGGLIK